MKRNKLKSRKGQSFDRKKGSLPDKSRRRNPYLVFSYRYFDPNQGQKFIDWELDKLLAEMTEKLRSLSNLTVIEATQKKIVKVYNKVSFPPNSNFYHPKHVPEGVKWAAIRIKGQERVIGFLEGFIFYIVFLDKNHEFWITQKRNT